MFEKLCITTTEWIIHNIDIVKIAALAAFLIFLAQYTTPTTFIAVCAMIATIWQAWLSRNHNKLSVKPHINIIVNRAGDKLVNLEIENNGLGPAILKKLQYSFNGVEIESIAEIANKFDLGDKTIITNSIPENNKLALAAGQRIELISIKNSKEDEDNRDKGLKFINNLDFNLTYESIYKEEFRLPRRTKKPHA